MKIRIFTLAKELNMESKVLIQYCQRLGIDIKDSALASISPEEKDRVLALIKQGAAPAADRPSKSAEIQTPTREPARHVGTRVPAIKSVPPRPTKEGRATPQLEEPSPSESERIEPAPASVEATEPVLEPAEVSAEAPPAPAVPVAIEPELEEQLAPAASVSESPEPVTGKSTLPPADNLAAVAPVTAPTAPKGTGGAAPTRETSPARSVAPLRREDYVPASGASRAFGREAPIDLGARARSRPKARPGPSLPQVAELPPLPVAPARPAVAEAPAQKPEVRFSRQVIAEGKPLTEHMRQHAEDKKKKKRPGEVGTVVEELVEEAPRTAAAKKTGAAAGMGLLSERKHRQQRRAKDTVVLEEEEAGRSGKIRAPNMRHKRALQHAAAKTAAEIEPPITVRSLSESLGRRAAELIKLLYQRGVMVTVNSSVEDDTALELALECGVDLHIKHERDLEQELVDSIENANDASQLAPRPPIITILGHVDHGKTTLLDKIRSTDVAAGEVGGITQHIAAYQVVRDERKLTFLDTPGHAAFAEMRARGANVTDIAVLVVAANDGVMPQTIEAINHARAADVPIVVAMNKSDLPDRNEQRVLQELAAQNVLAAEWGGDTEVVRTSGLTGAGLDELLETLLTMAELRELKADPHRPANGVCLEAFRDEGRGVLAWLIVRDGTLRKGDVIICGPAFGRIRSLYNDHDEEIDEAGPSMPIKMAGLDIIPGAGDTFAIVPDIEEARAVAVSRRERGREKQLSQRGRPRTLQDMLSEAQTGELRELPLIIKADTPGSVEALKGELQKFQHAEVRINILHDGVGGVNESDVYLASASNAIIVAFHVVPEDRAQALAEREDVEIRQYGIIYEVTDDIKKALEGLLRPERVEVMTGRAVVLKTFNISRFGVIGGCRVLNGSIERTNRIRLIRDQRIVNDYNIGSLKRGKDDVKEVRDGLECGIRLENFDDIKEGDLFQAYKVQEVKRTL